MPLKLVHICSIIASVGRFQPVGFPKFWLKLRQRKPKLNCVFIQLTSREFFYSELGNLIHVQSNVDLGRNRFSGSIPTEFGRFTKLKRYFAVNRNTLTGEIPSELGLLQALRSDVFLQRNNLCGDVPSCKCWMWLFTYEISLCLTVVVSSTMNSCDGPQHKQRILHDGQLDRNTMHRANNLSKLWFHCAFSSVPF